MERSRAVPVSPRGSAPPASAVREQLDRVLRSPGFVNAPGLSSFLRHLVEHLLSGQPDGAKEYTIAVEVFGRPAAFDPRTDTIVRVQARRLRTRLGVYYKTLGHADPVVIDVPRGTYRAKVHAAFPFLPHGCPRTASNPLVGRDDEIDTLASLLTDGRNRLVTVTGAGGTGKTRLAQHVTALVADSFPGGVFFTSVASVTHADEVASSTARALGLSLIGASTPTDALLAQASHHVRRASLLLLDNFEHLVAAAPLLVRLLDAVEPLTLLVTSRSVLRVTGEHEFSLAPLPLPETDGSSSLGELLKNPAVTLFVQRAIAANPRFAISSDNIAQVAEICCRVDGLPLAIELAAARIRMLSPGALLERLTKRLDLLTMGPRDLPERQRTLRATVEWSHQLLAEGERRLFRRLAVFAGGATLEGVEAVCNARLDLDVDVLNGMTSLVDKHLVERLDGGDGEPRFRMLETIREFALEQISEHDDLVTWRAHAAYCLVLAEEGTLHSSAEDRERWLARCEVEHDNFRAALDRLVREKDVDWALRLGAALYTFWDEREYLIEGRRRLEDLLRLPGSRTAQRAAAAKYAGALASHQGDHEAAHVLHRDALEIYESLGDRRGLVSQLIALGVQEHLAGRDADAEPWLDRGLQSCRELGDQRAVAAALGDLANCVRARGDHERAQQMLREALEIFTREGDRAGAASSLNQLGDVARARGDVAEARRLYEEGVTGFRDIGDSWGLARSSMDLGSLEGQSGQYAAARTHLARGLDLFFALTYRRGIANALDEFACLNALESRYTRTLVLAGAAAALRASLGAVSRFRSQPRLRAAVDQARRHLPSADADVAWTTGWRLSIEDARRYAVEANGDALPIESSPDR